MLLYPHSQGFITSLSIETQIALGFRTTFNCWMFFLSSPCSCVCYWMQPNRRSLQQPWGVSVSVCWADGYVRPEISILECTCSSELIGLIPVQSPWVPQFIVDENGGLEIKLAIGILESRLCWPANCSCTEYQLNCLLMLPPQLQLGLDRFSVWPVHSCLWLP